MTLHIDEPRTKRWTREEYYRLAQEGYFEGQRVQLIEGEIIRMGPQGHAHTKAVSVAARFLRSTFTQGFWVREEKPLKLAEKSEPEPDVAVVRREMEEYTDHPTTALLVVEVADSSIELDRRRKLRLYASTGIDEYWVVNMEDRVVEVHCRPNPQAQRYDDVQLFKPGQTIAPQLRPDAQLAVASLFS